VLILGLGALFYFTGIVGGVWLLLVVTLGTQWELYRLFERMELSPDKILGLGSGAAIILGSYYLVDPGEPASINAGNDVFVFCFLVLTLSIISKNLVAGRLSSYLPTLFGVLLIPYMFHFLVRLVRSIETLGHPETVSIATLAWLIMIAKMTDVGGLLSGMIFGINPLAPNISPKKTIEGAAGGLILCVSSSVAFALVIPEAWLLPGFTPLAAALLALPIGIVGIFSDLLESALKRSAGMKDSGRFVPGIGGAFDLTDSLILSAPFAYLLLKYSLLSP
jgi:phosphatidate cytidylyltransferase